MTETTQNDCHAEGRMKMENERNQPGAYQLTKHGAMRMVAETGYDRIAFAIAAPALLILEFSIACKRFATYRLSPSLAG